jgi:hypothetical protein
MATLGSFSPDQRRHVPGQCRRLVPDAVSCLWGAVPPFPKRRNKHPGQPSITLDLANAVHAQTCWAEGLASWRSTWCHDLQPSDHRGVCCEGNKMRGILGEEKETQWIGGKTSSVQRSLRQARDLDHQLLLRFNCSIQG